MQIYRSRFLTRGEVWYDDEPTQAAVDWIFYRQRSRPVPGSRWKSFYTYLLELNQSPQALWDQLSKSGAYKVKRARDKDKVICEALPPLTPALLDSFEGVYNRYAASKYLPPLDRAFLE